MKGEKNCMKQYEAVISAMKENGGYATLGHLYEHVRKIDGVIWKTKTPFASIRRIVQDERFFFKIRPGLWALNDMKGKLPFAVFGKKDKTKSNEAEFSHSYYQGLLVEIGNMKGFRTTVPNQDKNRKFLEKPLVDLVTADSFYPFTYDKIVQRAQTIDVVWFNERKLPSSVFEVEHSTDIQNSLLKFVELQDFRIEFKVVADEVRRSEFEKKLCFEAFRPLEGRVNFISYQTVSEMHTKSHELKLIAKNW
jgi:hypothetical protein